MKRVMLICSILSLAMLNGCSSHKSHDRSYADRSYDREVHRSVRDAEEYATVTDIDLVRVDSKTSGGGAVLGAVIGGVIGHQLGSGRGNDLATGAGAIGGAVAGNKIEKSRGSDDEIYRVTVRFPDGTREKYDYADINGLRVGDKVRVAQGQLYRL